MSGHLETPAETALTAARFIDRFEQIDGVHSGFRRNHAKGLGVSGFFESNGNGVRIVHPARRRDETAERDHTRGRKLHPNVNEPGSWRSTNT